MPLKYLADQWDENHAKTLDPPALLRYRSNLLGSDLRITNFKPDHCSSTAQTFTSTRSPLSTVELFHSAVPSVEEMTYLGMSLIRSR